MPTFLDLPLDQDLTGIPVDSPLGRELQRSFGTDLFFNGRLVVTASGDYQLVDGPENLRRALLRRYITTPGTYRLRPDYGAGLGDYLKKPMTKANLDELTVRMREQTARERRVDKVIEITLTPTMYDTQQGLHVYVRVQAAGRLIRPLTYAFKKEV